MGRWYAELINKSHMPETCADKTDKTPELEVLSVLSAPNSRISEKFSHHCEAFDRHADFEERAAIMEFDSGLTRRRFKKWR